MKKAVALLTFLKCCCIISAQGKSDAKSREQTASFSEKSEKVVYHYMRPEVPFNEYDGSKVLEVNPGDSLFQPLTTGYQHQKHHGLKYINPLEAALLLSSALKLAPVTGFSPNDSDLLPINPYLSLLLSHYGRYLPYGRAGKGLYGYAAANNYHNNKPFGAYKLYEEH